MKILLVSDSHGNNDCLKDLAKLYPSMDIYLHAGDSLAYDNYELEPFRAIKGNCDYYSNFLEEIIFPTPLGLLKMSHYPYLKQADYYKDIKIFIHGHTHRWEMEMVDNILYICPGSLSNSRKGEESYMIIDIDKEVNISLFSLSDHHLIKKETFNIL